MNKKAILIGYSGHGLVVTEILKQNQYKIVGYCDKKKNENDPFNLSFLGSEEDIQFEDSKVFVAIGNNKIRERIFNKLINRAQFGTVVHPKANVALRCIISDGVVVAAGAKINIGASVSLGCIINTGAIIEHECIIDDFAHIAPGAVLAGNVNVGKRSFIGANATVIQGINIGNDVVVGAGSVIIEDIPDNCTVVGNPGRIIKQII